jgi:hypothetical protein
MVPPIAIKACAKLVERIYTYLDGTAAAHEKETLRNALLSGLSAHFIIVDNPDPDPDPNPDPDVERLNALLDELAVSDDAFLRRLSKDTVTGVIGACRDAFITIPRINQTSEVVKSTQTGVKKTRSVDRLKGQMEKLHGKVGELKSKALLDMEKLAHAQSCYQRLENDLSVAHSDNADLRGKVGELESDALFISEGMTHVQSCYQRLKNDLSVAHSRNADLEEVLHNNASMDAEDQVQPLVVPQPQAVPQVPQVEPQVPHVQPPAVPQVLPAFPMAEYTKIASKCVELQTEFTSMRAAIVDTNNMELLQTFATAFHKQIARGTKLLEAVSTCPPDIKSAWGGSVEDLNDALSETSEAAHRKHLGREGERAARAAQAEMQGTHQAFEMLKIGHAVNIKAAQMSMRVCDTVFNDRLCRNGGGGKDAGGGGGHAIAHPPQTPAAPMKDFFTRRKELCDRLALVDPCRDSNELLVPDHDVDA